MTRKTAVDMHPNDTINSLLAEVERLRVALEYVLPLAENYLRIIPDRRGIHTPKIEAVRAALTKE